MNKRSIFLFIFFYMMINVAFGHTLVVNNFSMELEAGREVTLTAPVKEKMAFFEWRVISGELTLTNPRNVTITFTMPDNSVSLESIYNTAYTLTVNPGGQTYTQATDSTIQITAPTQRGNATVTYNYNGGRDTNTVVTADKVFNNWNLSGGGSISSGDTSPVVYTYGEKDATLTAEYINSVTLLTPTRADYIFDGWYTAAIDGDKVGNAGDIYKFQDSNITLYAGWKTGKNLLTIDLPDFTKTQKVTAGESITLEAITEKESYTFNGWTIEEGIKLTDEQLISKIITFTMPAKPVTITANYVESTVTEYTISYNANGGSGAPSSQTKTSGTALTLSSTVPTKAGYNFIGWNTNQSATTAMYQPGGSFTVDANTTLYAIWEEVVPETYTVTFNSNNGTNNTVTQEYTKGVPQNLMANSFTNYGYSFEGWSTTSTGEVKYLDEAEYTATGNITLYAVWEPERTITVDPNGGTWSDTGTSEIRTYTGIRGSVMYIPRITLIDGTWTGTFWGNGGTINGSDTYQVECEIESLSLYGENTGIIGYSSRDPGYKYTFGDYDEDITALHYAYLHDEDCPYTPIRTGYTFVGWGCGPNCDHNNGAGCGGIGYPSEDGLWLFALWSYD